MNIKIDKHGKLKIDSEYNIYKNESFTYISRDIIEEFLYENTLDFIKNNQGVLIEESDENIKIYVDPFRTIPLFIKNDDDTIEIVSELNNSFCNGMEIDEVGVWEVILYGYVIGTRTVFKNLKQFCGSTVFVYSKSDCNWELEYYWDYNFYKNNELVDQDLIVNELDTKLSSLFKNKINPNKNIIMGLSGGLDSRLSLSFIRKYIKKENLKTYTYGFNHKILEVEIAKNVTKVFELNEPEFFKLEPRHYIDSLETLVIESCAQISNANSHFYSLCTDLDVNHDKDEIISNFYSDAIFGYAAYEKEEEFNFAEEIKTIYSNKLFNQLESIIQDEIVRDYSEVLVDYDEDNNFCSLYDYYYLKERSVKFHVYISHIYNKFATVKLPFVDYGLLEFMMTIPQECRYQKNIIDRLLFNNKFPLNINDISSRYMLGKGKSGKKYKYLLFKILNRCNLILRIIFRGSVQFVNKYQTENQDMVFQKYFNKIYKKKLYKMKTVIKMNDRVFNQLGRFPFRPVNISRRYSLISLCSLLEKCNLL